MRLGIMVANSVRYHGAGFRRTPLVVIDLVQEPIWKTPLVITSADSPNLRMPTAARYGSGRLSPPHRKGGQICFLRKTSRAWLLH